MGLKFVMDFIFRVIQKKMLVDIAFTNVYKFR